MTVDRLESRIIDEDIARIIAADLPWERFRGSTVLVTGASGMIPSYVVYTMLGLNDRLGLGIKVLALVRNGEKASGIFGGLLERDDIELTVQDVTEPVDTGGPVDWIFHGASAADRQSTKRPLCRRYVPTSSAASVCSIWLSKKRRRVSC